MYTYTTYNSTVHGISLATTDYTKQTKLPVLSRVACGFLASLRRVELKCVEKRAPKVCGHRLGDVVRVLIPYGCVQGQFGGPSIAGWFIC